MEITREEKIKLEQSKRFWSLVIYIPLAVVILWVLGGVFNEVLGVGMFDDDFNAYNTGQLAGQGNWIDFWTNGGVVIDDPVLEGARAVNMCSVSPASNSSEKYGELLTVGTTYFYLKFYGLSTGTIRLGTAGNMYIVALNWRTVGSEIIFKIFDNSGWRDIDTISYDPDVWVKIGIDWNSTTHQFKILINDVWSELYTFDDLNTDLNRFNFEISCGADPYPTTYLDFINSTGEAPPLVSKVWAVDPASETEITSLTATFEFGWEDLDDYDSLSVVFQNRSTGIFSEAKAYEIEIIGVAGTKELTFSDFNFDRNGKFYFYAITSKYVPTVIEGMYLTGGYSYEWSEDLVDPEHWFTINISGLAPIFEMSDFETWYSVESKFATPTALFVSITGFFEPIFNKIGEFGSRIVDYFNVSEAYAQGYEIGKAIPYFSFFVEQTSLFLGGFPVLKWLFIVILLLVGIFIFRLILKFIPGLG